MKKNQAGFGAIEAVIAIVAVAIIIVIGAVILGRSSDPKNDKNVEDGGNSVTVSTNAFATPITWSFNESTNKYDASPTPPECSDRLMSKSPVDTTVATGVLYPGQYRGGSYKLHGGFAFTSSDATVVLPMDASVTGLVRYIESGETQYKVTFTNPCGIVFYFDHLLELSLDFQEIANSTPEAKKDDTKGLALKQPIPFKAGDIIARRVGIPATGNFGIDFGVIDMRSRNKISKNSTWGEIHDTYKASEWFGICWFDQLPPADAGRVKALPALDQQSGSRSDYCTNPTGTTLEVNSGKPV